MKISKNSVRTFNIRTGYHRHSMVRLADGRAASDVYGLHDGPDFVGYGRSVTKRPLTAEEWAAVENGEIIDVDAWFSTDDVEIAC